MSPFAKQLLDAEKALQSGDLGLAGKLLTKLLRSAPRHARANELMAYVAGNTGDLESLGKHLQIATSSADAAPTAWYSLGAWHFRNGRTEEAEAALRKALALKRDFFEANHDLGLVLHARGSYADALAAYDRALALNPANAATWLDRGETLHDLARMPEALESYARATALKPGYHEAISNEAQTRLALGDWERGWELFESRFRGAGALQERHGRYPRWDGAADLRGKRLLVWCEQGFGDTLQFCRYVPLLVQRGAEVVLEAQAPVAPLLAANLPCRVIVQGEPAPQCDLQIPLLSLPRAFRTTTASVPANVPYLNADPKRVEKWSTRLGRPPVGKINVALASSARSSYKHDRRRTIPLALFAPLTRFARIFLVQKDLREEERQVLSSGEHDIHYLGDEIEDFRDGAAITTCADLTMSIDTSLTHLAGALGRPVWVLLADVPDWRWMMERNDSPWYPSVRLFRQARAGDWPEVLTRVAQAMEAT